MEELVGKTLGQFQIIQELGRGGMAVVYKAYQPALQRYVALKVLPRQFAHDEGFVKRFRQEAIAAARLHHPNIVTIYDVGQVGDIQFIVMELLEGRSLSDLILQGGAMPPTRAAGLIAQIASALDYAHKQGFVHRDIKPGNVMVGANDHATLTDFGIARAMGAARMTQTGAMIGTPQYMAPEQVRGLPVDHRADIYALGIVCYEMLTGQVPFVGDTAAILYKQAHELPPPLSQLAPRVSPAMTAAVSKALAKQSDERFQHAGEFAAALSSGATLPSIPARPVKSSPTLLSSAKSGKPGWLIGIVGVTAFVFVCLVLLVVLALVRPGQTSETPTPGLGVAGSGSPTPTPTLGVTSEVATTIVPVPTSLAATPTPLEPTQNPVCTPPPCAVGEVYYCPGDCPGGCGTECATPTLVPHPATDTPTYTPSPSCPVVIGPFAGIWQSAQSKLGCATNDAHDTWMAEEFFERGVMYWRQDQDRNVIAIYNGGGWGIYLGDWKEGDPEFTCGPESSPPTPKRGFGWAWCNYSEIRDGLGRATTEESGFNGTVQDFERGVILRTDDGTTFVLYSGDGWEKR